MGSADYSASWLLARLAPAHVGVAKVGRFARHPSGSVCNLPRADLAQVAVKRRLLGPRGPLHRDKKVAGEKIGE